MADLYFIWLEYSRPVHTRHNLNAYLIRYWMILVPSTLLKSKLICQTYKECP